MAGTTYLGATGNIGAGPTMGPAGAAGLKNLAKNVWKIMPNLPIIFLEFTNLHVVFCHCDANFRDMIYILYIKI